VSDADAVKRVVDDANADAALPLRGVFHAAGSLEDGLVLSQDPAAAAKVAAAKVDGSFNLHRHTAHLPLDVFVCFSSIAACIGAPGQAGAAAGNAYMGALAGARAAAGLAGHVVHWGPWADAGMAARLDARKQARIAALGIAALGADEALAALASLL